MPKKLKPWPLLTLVGLGTTFVLACSHGRGGPLVAVPSERTVQGGRHAGALPPQTTQPRPAEQPAQGAPPIAQEAQVAAIAPAAGEGLAPAMMPPAQAELFTSKDADGDGGLSIEEFSLGLAPITADEAAAMFASLDQDANGKIVLAEYFPDPASIQAYGEGVSPPGPATP